MGKAGSLIENTSWWTEKSLTRGCPMREEPKELIKILSPLHRALYEPEGLVIAMYRGGGSTRDISKTKITGVPKEEVEAFRGRKMKGSGGGPEATARVPYLVAVEMNEREDSCPSGGQGRRPARPALHKTLYTMG